MPPERATPADGKPNPASVAGSRRYDFAIGFDTGWLSHSGEIPGFNTQIAYLPKEKITIVVFANADIAGADGNPAPTIFRALTKVVTSGNPVGEAVSVAVGIGPTLALMGPTSGIDVLLAAINSLEESEREELFRQLEQERLAALASSDDTNARFFESLVLVRDHLGEARQGLALHGRNPREDVA
jgi:hypothetical protein